MHDPARKLKMPVRPAVRLLEPPAPGPRQKLLELGPEKFADWVRGERRLLITDTTLRDAHQSLLATRVRTYDMLRVADAISRTMPNLFSLEMWGGATFDTSMRFLQEDPWERLAELRQRIPNILFQMLLRASNAVGYTSYPDNVVRAFIKRSAADGIDIFRIFDSLNSSANMRLAIEIVRQDTSAICEAAICYTGDILDPARTKYSLKYYVKLAKELVNMGTHILGIKDMAGLCKPYAAYTLVKALREEVGVPIHFPHARHERRQLGQHSARGRRRRGHRGRGDCAHERRDKPAVPQQHRRRAAPHGARHGARRAGARRDEPLLGRRPRALLPVRRRHEGARAGRVSARDAGRPVHEPEAAGANARARGSLARGVPGLCDGESALRRHRRK